MAARGHVAIEVRQIIYPELKESPDLSGVVRGFTVTDDRRVNRHRWNALVREVDEILVEHGAIDHPLGSY